jgi:LuxR family transcriptional regulator, maltose regulon positive regulatory protein
LARLQVLQGRLHQALATYEEAVRALPEPQILPAVLSGPAYYFGLGDLLHEFARLATSRAFVPHLSCCATALQAQIALAQGNLAAAIHWAEVRGLSEHDELSYPHEGEYLTLARVRIAQARANRVGHVLSDTLRLLDRLLQDAEAKGRMSSRLQILLLRALASHAGGDAAIALATLERVLALSRGLAPDYLTILLTASGSQSAAAASRFTARSAALVEPLSERELEVLHLLATGVSNDEIAEHLVIAVSTVKRHVSNILAKLTISNRTQAVTRAQELGLM